MSYYVWSLWQIEAVKDSPTDLVSRDRPAYELFSCVNAKNVGQVHNRLGCCAIYVGSIQVLGLDQLGV